MEKKTFTCAHCFTVLFSEVDALNHTCGKIVHKSIRSKKTRSDIFAEILSSMDISWGLAFMGLVIVNTVITHYMHIPFYPRLLESIAIGFAIPRLLK
jgi:hypothetical protein